MTTYADGNSASAGDSVSGPTDNQPDIISGLLYQFTSDEGDVIVTWKDSDGNKHQDYSNVSKLVKLDPDTGQPVGSPTPVEPPVDPAPAPSDPPADPAPAPADPAPADPPPVEENPTPVDPAPPVEDPAPADPPPADPPVEDVPPVATDGSGDQAGGGADTADPPVAPEPPVDAPPVVIAESDLATAYDALIAADIDPVIKTWVIAAQVKLTV